MHSRIVYICFLPYLLRSIRNARQLSRAGRNVTLLLHIYSEPASGLWYARVFHETYTGSQASAFPWRLLT